MTVPAGANGGAIAIMGAGAVGAYVGGMLALAGETVILIDPWHAHVERMREAGLTLETPEGVHTVWPRVLALGEIERLRQEPVGLCFLCAKLYDTEWATLLLLPHLAPDALLVTMQNGLVDGLVAQLAGPARTLGCIAGTLDVALTGPGIVRRARRRNVGKGAVFKVGELDGRETPRAAAIAARLARVDQAGVTTRLIPDRWVKLCANTMTSGLSGAGGLALIDVYRRDDTRLIAVRLGAEALAVAAAAGVAVPALFGLAPARWASAAAGDRTALGAVMDALAAQATTMIEGGPSGTLQDLRKGRRTEVDYFNGFIAAEAARLGVPAPTHDALAGLLRRLEAGALQPGLDTLMSGVA